VDKIYIIVRNDIAPGLQAAQACHALREFAKHHEALEAQWFRDSNNIVILQVPSEDHLLALTSQAEAEGIPYAEFHEPDLEDEATAIALGPTGARLVSQLPLALREKPTSVAA
jgi:peptidyl-tRNA hydrolase